MVGSYPVFDGHNDVLSKLAGAADERFFDGDAATEFDLPSARAGGVTGGLFAVFPEEPPEHEGRRGSTHLRDGRGTVVDVAPAVTERYARARAFDQLARLYRIERRAEGDVEVVRTAADLRRSAADETTLTAVVHFEGAEPLGHDLSHLPAFYAAGLRSLGLVWSRPNAFGHGVPFRRPSTPDLGPGLTARGRELVRRCNRLGVVVDLAHLNEAGFWDAAEESTDPLVVSHTAAHELSPSARNLTDEQLDAVGESDGLVGVTFHVPDVHPDCERDTTVSVDVVADHVDYVADRIGVDHVAVGSDFDGATPPDALGDAGEVQTLFRALERRGYDREEIRRIARDNWVSTLAETMASAEATD
ncbi:MAG: dipeptidase [Haloplanus sp.]